MKLLNGLGLGTFPFASPFTKVDKESAKKIVATFIEHGGKYIDTSPTYAFGDVEVLLGEILKQINRDSFFINSSCGFVRNGDKYVKSGKYNDVIKECEDSLTRLGLNELDLYISHTPDTETGAPFSETIAALEELKKQGKIKAIGVSNVNLDQLKEYNESNSIQFIQNRFSLLNQNFNEKFVNYCQENEIGIIAFQVIERGLLTEKFINTKTEFDEGDLRNRKPEFEYNVRKVITQWVKSEIYPISVKYNIPISALAIKWALSKEYISLCQCGATNVNQVYSNLKAVSDEALEAIYEIDISYNRLTSSLMQKYKKSVISFMGISIEDTLKGSATGK